MSKFNLNKEFSDKDLSDFFSQRNNPKSIYYYMSKLLDVASPTNIFPARISWSGEFNINFSSQAKRVLDAVYMTQRNRPGLKGKTGSINFILDLFPHQLMPKSRLIKIVSRKSMPVLMPNPNFGKNKIVTYGLGGKYTSSYPEPEFITNEKNFIMYTRNMWDRKTELKAEDISDAA